MNKFMNFLKRHSKKLALATGVVSIAAVGTAATIAWGPDRPTYTIQNPANHITFNSITNNPNYGDERTFLDAKPASNTNQGGFTDKNTVQDGQEILVRAYVHNNANANLNLVAKNTKYRLQLPTGTHQNLRLNGFISADNAQPQTVYDHTDLAGASPFSVEYVPGSAMVYTNAVPSGMKAADSIVTSGAPLGYDKLDGNVPGCFQYTALVTVKLKVKMPKPNFTMSKEVAKAGGEWKEDVKVEPGETVSYRIQFKNTGATELKNVIIKDKLPTHMTYVQGSSMLYNSSNPSGLKVSDKVVSETGINIGNYQPGANAVLVFKAKISDKKDELCKAGVLKNVATVIPEGQTPDDDDATVTPPECENPQPAYDCTALEAVALGDNKYKFTTTVKAENGATVNKYVYNFGDATEELNTDKNVVEHQYAKPGEYEAYVRVVFNIGTTQKETRCSVKVVIPENPCPIPGKEHLPVDSPECKENPTPETPQTPGTPQSPVTVIPETGAAGVLAGIFGTSATVYGAYTFVQSRRALKNLK